MPEGIYLGPKDIGQTTISDPIEDRGPEIVDSLTPIAHPEEQGEKNKATPFEIIVLPRIAEDTANNAYLKDTAIERENLHKAKGIISYLRQIPPEIAGKFAIRINHAAQIYDDYEKRLIGIQSAPETNGLIEARLKSKVNLSDREKTSGIDIQELLRNHFETTPSDAISLAESHLATLYSIEAAQEAALEMKPNTAVMVFDNHEDIYKGDEPWKGNIFRLLAERKSIAGAAFFRNFEEPGAIYVDQQISKPENKLEPNLSNKEKVQAIVTEAVESFVQRDITNILISIDIDVLRAKTMGYTAMEYNPSNILGFLSSVDLSELDLPDDPKEMTEYYMMKLRDRLLFPDHRTSRTSPLNNGSDTFDPSGIRLSELGIALETIFDACQKRGINIGIDLKGGGRYIGDIVELSGFDYGERTTRAVSALSDKIKALVAKYKTRSGDAPEMN